MLLPDPDTPVTHTKQPRGMSALTFLRLFSVAPVIVMVDPLPARRDPGKGIIFVPLKYCPVRDLGLSMISDMVPVATTFPPCSPAPGPMSIIWSADLIMASSCSTTITVLPISLRSDKVVINIWSSCGCNPMVGSSQTYKTPVKPDPICVAKRTLCASPPDKVRAVRSMVR